MRRTHEPPIQLNLECASEGSDGVREVAPDRHAAELAAFGAARRDEPVADDAGRTDEAGQARMDGAELSAFKSGIYHLASHRPDVAFIPTWIDNVNRVLPKGEILPVPMLGSITMGAPLKLAPDESREAFLARAKSALEALQKD